MASSQQEQKLNMLHIRNGNKTLCVFWYSLIFGGMVKSYRGDVKDCENECIDFEDCFKHCPYRKRLKNLEYIGDNQAEKNRFCILQKINSLRIKNRNKHPDKLEEQYVMEVAGLNV